MVLAGRKSISGKLVTYRALSDLGVGLTGNVVESPGEEKKKPSARVWLRARTQPWSWMTNTAPTGPRLPAATDGARTCPAPS